MIKMILIVIGGVILLILATDISRAAFLVHRTNILIAKSVPFSRTVPNATMHILVLGDSTAVGTGSALPADSTAGRLGALYPNADVENLAVNGLKIGGLLDILKGMNMKQHFDIVLIQIGANDIIKLTSMKDIDTGIAQVLTDVQSFGGKVIVLHSGDIGQSPFFPWYLRSFYTNRSYETRAIYQKEASAHGATYIDLIDSNAALLLRQDPDMYYANDDLHLSSAGYGLWFDEIKKAL